MSGDQEEMRGFTWKQREVKCGRNWKSVSAIPPLFALAPLVVVGVIVDNIIINSSTSNTIIIRYIVERGRDQLDVTVMLNVQQFTARLSMPGWRNRRRRSKSK